MNEQELIKRLNLLEYHQKLLMKMMTNPKLDFYKIVVEKGATEQEVEVFFKLCDVISIKMEEQKAEGFIHFYPLFKEFTASLPANFNVDETVTSCLTQNLFPELMQEFKKYI